MSRKRKLILASKGLGIAWGLNHRQLASITVAACSVAAVRARRKLGLPSAVSTACGFAAAPVLAAGFERSRVRDGAVWAAQMWAYKTAFEIPYDDEDRHRNRTHFEYPITIDTRIGGGTPPSQRMQRRLRTRGELSWLDKALSLLYWTWEAEPHLAMMWIRWRRPDDFTSAAGRLAATFDATLLGYWMIPTAPPWWVSEKLGRMDAEVRRVMPEVASWLKREPNPTEGDHEIGANPFAAMPSDHFASAAMTAMLLSEQSRRLGAAAWTYALGLGVALIYLGEHYVIDELAGLTLALAVNRFRRPFERIATAVLQPRPCR